MSSAGLVLCYFCLLPLPQSSGTWALLTARHKEQEKGIRLRSADLNSADLTTIGYAPASKVPIVNLCVLQFQAKVQTDYVFLALQLTCGLHPG